MPAIIKTMKNRSLVPDLLKEARKSSKKTQKKLAYELGYSSPQIVSNWERGSCPLPIEKYSTFCKATGLNPEDLINALTTEYGNNLRALFKTKKQ